MKIENIEQIEEELRKTAPQLPAHLRLRVLQRAEESAADQPTHRVRLVTWRQPRASVIWRYAAAMAIAGGTYAGLTLTSPGPSAPAFAQVERAMQEVKTARWIATHAWTSTNGKTIQESIDEVWIRFDPPVYASRVIAPTHNKYSRAVIDAHGQTLYEPATKRHYFSPMVKPIVKQNRIEFVRKIILDSIFAPRVDQVGSKLNTNAPVEEVAWTSVPVTFRGQPAIRFYREYSRRAHGRPKSRDQNATIKHTIWADPKTYRIVRSELRFDSTQHGGGISLNVKDKYRYNEEPPKGTFDLGKP